MKKLFLIAVALVASTVAAQASTVLATCLATTTWSEAKALGSTGCQVEDKIFRNFNVTAGYTDIPPDYTVILELLYDGTHNVDISKGASKIGLNPNSTPAGPWGIEYDVQVDTTYRGSLHNYITSVGINLNAGGSGVGLLTKWVYDINPNTCQGGTPTSCLIGTGSTTAGAQSFVLAPPSQWIHVVETLSISTGQLSSFTDTYTQGNIPEPGTYAMMGLGLAALGLISRRKKA